MLRTPSRASPRVTKTRWKRRATSVRAGAGEGRLGLDGDEAPGHRLADGAVRQREQRGAGAGPGLDAADAEQVGARDHPRGAAVRVHDREARDVALAEELVGLREAGGLRAR